jgi:hypothetical protein
MINAKVGDKVRLKYDLNEPPSENSPGGCLARHDEVLIIRQISEGHDFPIKVSHENVTDRSFGVLLQEIKLIEGV